MEILIISEETLPPAIKNVLKANNCVLHYARGPLSLESKLLHNNIQAVIWLNSAYFKKLYLDICEVLNKTKPEVYFLGDVSLSTEEESQLQTKFYYINDVKDIVSPKKQDKTSVKENELDFRYMLRNIGKKKDDDSEDLSSMKFENNPLSSDEKDLLKTSGQLKETKTIWQKLFNW